MPDPRDVVLLYGPPWDDPTRLSKHHLACYLAERGGRVLYVEAPLGPLTLLRRRAAALPELRAVARGLRPVGTRLWATRYFNPLPYHGVYRLTASPPINAVGQRLLAPFLRRDLRRLGFRQPLVIAGLPHAVDLVPLIPHRGLVYHCADDYASVRGFPPTLPALERRLCERADLVVVTAEALLEPRRRWNPRTEWIPNGVDVERFSARIEPAAEMVSLSQGEPVGGEGALAVPLSLSAAERAGVRGKAPVVGFVGTLAQWVDVPLLRHLAERRPEWQLALVGPASTDVSTLRGLPNVHLLGPRSYDYVPRYLAGMDVALVPFVQDAVTRNADPIKVYEYLAAGVPVVASDLPALQRLRHVVRLADSPDAFLAGVDAALAAGRESGRAERQAEAARHSWTARFQHFDFLLDEYLPFARGEGAGAGSPHRSGASRRAWEDASPGLRPVPPPGAADPHAAAPLPPGEATSPSLRRGEESGEP